MKNTNLHRATGSPCGFNQVAGAIAALTGSVVLAGWFFDIDALKSVLPGAVSMKANTALCFLLTGVAMYLLARAPAAAAVPQADAFTRRDRLMRLAVATCLGTVIVVAALTLLEYFIDANIGIDELLFKESPSPGTSHPGRMAPNTAAAFILLGGGLWAMARSKSRGPILAGAGLTVLLALLLGLVSVMGYVGDVPIAFGWGGLTKMALHTGVLFTLVGAAGLRLLWHRSGLLWGISGWLVGAFATGIVLLITLSFISYRQVRESLEHTGWVQHSDQVLIKIRDVRTISAELFSTARIYLLTGREDLTSDNRQLADLLTATHSELLILTEDNPGQQERLRQLEPLLRDEVQFTELLISTRRTSGIEAASALVATGRGLQLFADIKSSVEAFHREEQRLWDLRERYARASVNRLFLILPLGTFLTLTLFLMVLIYLNVEVVERRKAIDRLKQREQMLRIAGSVAHLGGWTVEFPGVAVAWSDEVCAIHGMPIGTIPTLEQALGFYTPASRAMMEPAFAACVRDGTPFDLELEIVTAQGQTREIRSMGSAVTRPDGTIQRVQGAFQDITELKATRRKLQQGMSLLRMAGAIAKVGGWSVSIPGNELYWSDEIYDIIDCPLGPEPPLEQALALYPEPWRSQIGEAITLCATHGTPFELDLMIKTFKGRSIWVRCKAEAGRDEGGRIFQVCGAFQDISAEREAEEKAAALGNRLVNTLEAINDAFFTLDPDWRFTYINGAAEILLERKRAELLGQKVWEEFPEAVDSEFYKAYHRALETQRFVSFESFYPPLDKWFEVRAHPSAEGLAVYFGDVTERRKDREALRASEERFRSLVTATSQMVWHTNAEGMVSDPLTSWRAYTGQTEAEVQGAGWGGALHPDDVARTLRVWQRAVETRSLYEVDCRIRRADGVYRDFYVRGVPVLNEDGSVREWMGTCTDITEWKQADEEIRKLNENLEQRVLARTAQLEAANKELESFSYSVSHDLRAPLRSVDSFARIILEEYGDKLDAEGQRLLGIVCGEAKRMGQLIDDLLDFSRMGRQHLATGHVNMTALAGEVFDNLPLATRKHVRHFEVKPLPDATVDRSMFRQVFVNLIGNAVKFTGHAADAAIEVGCTTADGMHNYYVRDNGAGFDDRYLHKLFGVFQRLHAEHEFEGTGVGLAIVQRIVHRHGGKVRAEGKINQGATFYFALPIREQP